MVGFLAKPSKTVEEELTLDQDFTKVKPFKDTLDFPSIDSFLDFDSVNWLSSNRNIEEFSIEDTDFDFFEDELVMGQEQENHSELIEVKTELCDELIVKESEPVVVSDNSRVMVKTELCDELVVKESEPVVVSENSRVMESESTLDESELKGLASSIEVGLGKVSLTMDDDREKEKNDSVESENETSSSSGSSSSEEEESDEEKEGNEKEKKIDDQMTIGKEDDIARELEEGEIESVNEKHEDEVEDDDDDDEDDEVNEMIAWSNDEDEDIGLQTKEPIRSKNELKELPPVAAVDVTLEPHHITLPVGVILSVISTQVIVEGMEKHSPLTEGSILWITEKRTPLGLVDEIFGPVKCPYYIVRFNSESEVPEGISQGTHISFVADFAQHILNIKELQKKGYDASGDNDEEISDELEFSDDEKEAEYRRMQKMEKRGMGNDQKLGNTRNKKKKNRDLRRPEWSENQGSSDPQMGGSVSNLQPRHQMDGFRPNSGGWRPPSNHQQNQYQLPPIPNPMGMANLSQMQIPLMAMQNQMMFQPHFNDGQMFFPGQASAPWPGLIGQNFFNQQQFGMGRGIQQQQPLPNDMSFNMFASQELQMHQPQSHMQQRPQSPMNPQFQMQPQFQTPMNPQYQMMQPPQPPVNPQFQMQPQSDMHQQSQIPHSPSNSQSQMQPQGQGFSTGQSSERGRGQRGRFRGRGRGRFGRGRGRGR